MSDMRFILPGPETITISGQDADKLLREGDGDAALLYLFILKTRGAATASEAARVLRKSDAEIKRLMASLGKLGLIRYGDEPAATPRRDELPEYTAADIKNEMDKGEVFSSLVRETQKRLGKILSSDDLQRLFGIYDHLGLPPDVVLQLVGYCVLENEARYGAGRTPTMRYIEKAAYTWEREAIFSLELAEEYIKRAERRKSASGDIRRVLQIRDRELTSSERRYVDGWIERGFPPESIEIAYDRTLLKTGKLAWGYMDSIIASWHNKGLHTPEEIMERDAPPGQSKKPPDRKPAPSGPQREDIERMEKMLKKIKGDE